MNAHDVLKEISEFGLLGFSPGNDEGFKNFWNRATFDTLCYAGSDIIKKLLDQGASVASAMAPSWFVSDPKLSDIAHLYKRACGADWSLLNRFRVDQSAPQARL